MNVMVPESLTPLTSSPITSPLAVFLGTVDIGDSPKIRFPHSLLDAQFSASSHCRI